jgi:hypothetical protein
VGADVRVTFGLAQEASLKKTNFSHCLLKKKPN